MWVNAYESQGYNGLKVPKRNDSYSLDFNLKVVKLYLIVEMSYEILANEININNLSIIFG